MKNDFIQILTKFYLEKIRINLDLLQVVGIIEMIEEVVAPVG